MEHLEEQMSTTPNDNLTPEEYKQIHDDHDKMVEFIKSPEDYIRALSSSVPMLGQDNPECITFREWMHINFIYKLPFLPKPYLFAA